MAASCAVSSAGDAATSSWKRGTRSKSTSRHPWKGWRYGVSCGPASATIDASAVSWAIVDIANFYVSAERLFDPALRDVPVIVLSNNDGCAIARSEEAKALHVRMGDQIVRAHVCTPVTNPQLVWRVLLNKKKSITRNK